jgi:hypothetical protein
MYRKRRKKSGGGLSEELKDQLDALQPLKDAGLFCKNCRKWYKWKDFHTSYDTHKLGFIRLWFCNRCGECCKEELLDAED